MPPNTAFATATPSMQSSRPRTASFQSTRSFRWRISGRWWSRPARQRKKASYKLFVSDVKKHIDAIAQKYIAPDEGTFDFALMYIPAENIYYETIIKNDDYDDETNIYNYGVPAPGLSVSPNTFYAQLHVLALGFKGMEVEKSAKEIIQNLARLQGDLQRLPMSLKRLGNILPTRRTNTTKPRASLIPLKKS